MDSVHADHRIGTAIFGQERQPAMTTNEKNPAMRVPSRTANHRRLEYRLDCGRDVHAEEIRITPSTLGYLAGSRDHIRADLIRQLKERVRGQFPGSGVLVRPVPRELPRYLIMVLLVCQKPVSDPHSDLSTLTVCWLGDDIETPLRELISREIFDVEWDKYAVDGCF
ncbi:MAG TPA: hypothetical protein VE957_19755 [Terriglobales bacterium]|nr:hypothetical protein [Terriglobales bacterium]